MKKILVIILFLFVSHGLSQEVYQRDLTADSLVMKGLIISNPDNNRSIRATYVPGEDKFRVRLDTFTVTSLLDFTVWDTTILAEDPPGLEWEEMAKAETDNNEYATVSTSPLEWTAWLIGKHANAAIPSNSRIIGIEVKVRAFASVASDTNPSLIVGITTDAYGGDANYNDIRISPITDTEAEYTFGGPYDNWGLNLIPADINNDNFGITIKGLDSTDESTISVDYAYVKIYHTVTTPSITMSYDVPVEFDRWVVFNGYTQFTGFISLIDDGMPVNNRILKTDEDGLVGGIEPIIADNAVLSDHGDGESHWTDSLYLRKMHGVDLTYDTLRWVSGNGGRAYGVDDNLKVDADLWLNGGAVITGLGGNDNYRVWTNSTGVLSAKPSDTVGLGTSLDGKAPKASPTFTGWISGADIWLTGRAGLSDVVATDTVSAVRLVGTTSLNTPTINATNVYLTGRIATTDVLATDTLSAVTLVGTTNVTFPTGWSGALKATAGVVSAYTPKDTIVFGPAILPNLTAADSITLCRVEQSGMNIRAIRCHVIGGTSATVNVMRIRATATANCKAANQVVNAAAITADFTDLTSLQNTDLLIGDILVASVRAVSGTVWQVAIEVVCDKNQL